MKNLMKISIVITAIGVAVKVLRKDKKVSSLKIVPGSITIRSKKIVLS